ncbi:MAG TPA: universal stress protein, partial [Gammaproteobacteria bacterium]|nr:universal stress protein [Gammaproteobacteria bacterium]
MLATTQKPDLFDSVLHPTDFSRASERAFAHALALALIGATRFTLLHVGHVKPGQRDWQRFPAVRGTLERWGLLEPGSPRSAVFEQLQVRVEKIVVPRGSPASAVLMYSEDEPFDLIVLGTEGREGVSRWLKGSRAEALARATKTLSLFVPDRAERGFVSAADGAVSLGRVLVPVDHEPPAHGAIAVAKRLTD